MNSGKGVEGVLRPYKSKNLIVELMMGFGARVG